MVKQLLKQTLNLGVEAAPSSMVAKKLRLLNTYSLALIVSVPIYYFLLSQAKLNFLAAVCIPLTLYYVLVLFLNHKGFINFTRVCTTIVAGGVIFLFHVRLPVTAGIDYYYFLLICVPHFFFSFEEKRMRVFATIVCFTYIALGMIISSYGWFAVSLPNREFLLTLHNLSLSIAIGIVFVAMYFFSLQNHSAEAELKKRNADIIKAQEELLVHARKSGMAEIAINTLHNVGNLLNSVTVSLYDIGKTLNESKLSGLTKATELLRSHPEGPREFFATDDRGEKLGMYVLEVERALAQESKAISNALQRASEAARTIKDVIQVQQNEVGRPDFFEVVTLRSLVDSCLEVTREFLNQGNIEVEVAVDAELAVRVLKSKFIAALNNVLVNAVEAFSEVPSRQQRKISIRSGVHGSSVALRIEDNGPGIPEGLEKKIFSHGFTTKKDGHGFGLHSVANDIGSMSGNIKAKSNQGSEGSVFTITLPLQDLSQHKENTSTKEAS